MVAAAVPDRFGGKVVIVTGAASGIGRTTARRLDAEGASVVAVDLSADRTAEALDGTDAQPVACDITDSAAVTSTVEGVVAAHGGLDVVANVAGVLSFGHAHETGDDEWQRILGVNLTGTFWMCRAALPHLVTRGAGAIVNVASSAALQGTAWAAAYSASKGGVLALTRTLAIEYGRQGVRVNAVCPAGVDTPMNEAFAFPEGADHTLIERIMPYKDYFGPEEVAAAICFLASADAAQVNGEHLRVDGGTLS